MPNFKKITPPNFVRKTFSVVFAKEYLKKQATKILTGHSLSERSQSQIRKQHNEIEFFGTKLCPHKDFANQKACIFIAVNFRHYQF